MCMLDATDVADFLVQDALGKGKQIQTRRLHLLVYFAWVEYYRERGEYLFSNPFYAWRFGPVVEEVRLRYRIFGAMPISYCRRKKDDPPISEEYTGWLTYIADYLDTATTQDLARLACAPYSAWESARDGSGIPQIISRGEITSRISCR